MRLLPLILLLLASCASTTPSIVAHRGASDEAPENTMVAFELAWALDADAIEGDFHLTRDGHIVCIHDETTGRTAGTDLVVAESTLEELRELEYGSWKNIRFTNEPIPTLEQVLETVPGGKRILIEIKIEPHIVPELQRVVEASSLHHDQMVVIAFDEEVIAEVKARMPWMTAYWLSGFDETDDGGWTPTVDEVVATAKRIGADGVDVQGRPQVVDEAFVEKVRAAGLELHVWTIKTAANGRRMAALGVDSITTPRPRWMRQQIASKP